MAPDTNSHGGLLRAHNRGQPEAVQNIYGVGRVHNNAIFRRADSPINVPVVYAPTILTSSVHCAHSWFVRRENKWMIQVLKASGLTQEQICSILGVGRREINYWGSGGRVPSETILQRASRALLTPLDHSLPEDFPSFEDRARVANSSFLAADVIEEAGRLLGQGFHAAQNVRRFHVFLNRFEEFMQNAEEDLGLSGISKERLIPECSLRQVLQQEYFAELSQQADELAYQSSRIQPGHGQGSVRQHQELHARKLRLHSRAERITKRITNGRVTDKALLSFFQKRKSLVLPDRTFFRYRKGVSLDKVFTFHPRMIIEEYWRDVLQRSADGASGPHDFEFEGHDLNFVPELRVTRLKNGLDFVVPEDAGKNHARLVKVDYSSGSTPKLPWKDFSSAKLLPAHLGFACRVTINKNELGFLRLRATDARGNDLLSPVFCSDSTGAHVVFQHWQYPLEEVKTLYHDYFDQKSSVSKTVSKGVGASRPGQKRALGNMGIDKGM